MSAEKILILVRHAKSSWKEPGLSDFDRPLNQRGQRDAPRMGKRLANRVGRPDLIVSSPAVRALTTAQIIAAHLGYEPAHVMVNEQVYAAGAGDLIEVIQTFDNRCDRVMLVGHNPAMTELVNRLARSAIENIPTCGVVVLSFAMDTWITVGHTTAAMLDFDYPKRPEV